MTSDLLTVGELASRWGCKKVFLWRMRKLGTGPAWLRIGRLVRYRLCDVVAWESQQIRTKEEL